MLSYTTAGIAQRDSATGRSPGRGAAYGGPRAPTHPTNLYVTFHIESTNDDAKGHPSEARLLCQPTDQVVPPDKVRLLRLPSERRLFH